MSRFISPFVDIVMLKMNFSMDLPSLRRIYDIASKENDKKHTHKIDFIKDIKLHNINFAYKTNQPVLNNLTMNFEKKKKYLICGKSGIGKSTIINLILGLWDPNSGQILMNNENIKMIDIDSIRSKISGVSQNTFFLHDTLYNNLSNDNSVNSKNEKKVWEALKKVDMYDDVKKMPKGLHTIMEDKGMTLSGGQRQRLAIARSLLKKSDVLIFDEPTSSLDKKTEKVILEAIEATNDKIVIVVSHNNEFMNIVDSTYELQEGGIIKNGKQNNKNK